MSITEWPIAFVDTETLGLDPDKHAIWEVGLIRYNPETGDTDEYLWQINLTPEQLADGDPIGMGIGRFSERYYRATAFPPDIFAMAFADLTAGAHLAGAVVSFDEERLRRLLLSKGVSPGWHYHIIDIEAMAVGYLNGCTAGANARDGGYRQTPEVARVLPWKSDALTEALGVPPVPEYERHTALGDARWALRLYQAMTKGA